MYIIIIIHVYICVIMDAKLSHLANKNFLKWLHYMFITQPFCTANKLNLLFR